MVKPFNVTDHIQASLGLGYLASNVRDRHNVEILDCIKDRVTPLKFRDYINRKKPDLIGIQCYTFDIYPVKEMLEASKEIGAVTVLGGPQPSAEPVETMEFFGNMIDFMFVGEAETGFSKLADKLGGSLEFDFDKIEGLVWRQDNNVNVNRTFLVHDLDKINGVAWDLIKPEEYPEAQHGAFFKRFPIAPIMVTRGCPYECTFCAGKLISGRKFRKRSIESVLDEITMLYRDHGIREFHIIDDNFTLDKRYAKDLLKSLRGLNLGISWAVPNGIRMDTLDDELLILMKETGLYLISLGIESGSDKILKAMKKGITVDSIRRAVSLIRNHGIEIAGFFILGFPKETIDDIKATIGFSLELDLIRANYFTYLPFPGTESYKELKAQGKLGGIDLKKFFFMAASFTPEGIDKRTLKKLQRQAFLRFFLRPRIMLKNLSQIKTFNHFRYLFMRAVRWMFMK